MQFYGRILELKDNNYNRRISWTGIPHGLDVLLFYERPEQPLLGKFINESLAPRPHCYDVVTILCGPDGRYHELCLSAMPKIGRYDVRMVDPPYAMHKVVIDDTTADFQQ